VKTSNLIELIYVPTFLGISKNFLLLLEMERNTTVNQDLMNSTQMEKMKSIDTEAVSMYEDN
jgi:hypothetical protein